MSAVSGRQHLHSSPHGSRTEQLRSASPWLSWTGLWTEKLLRGTCRLCPEQHHQHIAETQFVRAENGGHLANTVSWDQPLCLCQVTFCDLFASSKIQFCHCSTLCALCAEACKLILCELKCFTIIFHKIVASMLKLLYPDVTEIPSFVLDSIFITVHAIVVHSFLMSPVPHLQFSKL